MIVFINGVHGVGKTSVANAIRLDKPTVKMLDLDLSPKVTNDLNKSNQYLRHMIYREVVDTIIELPDDYVIIIDRTPISLNIYDRVFNELGYFNDDAYRGLENDYRARILPLIDKIYASGHQLLNVYLKIPKKVVFSNILARGRGEALNEQNETYYDAVVAYYNNFIKTADKRLNVFKPIVNEKLDKRVMYEDIIKQVERKIMELDEY
jgi:hypothetical protein